MLASLLVNWSPELEPNPALISTHISGELNLQASWIICLTEDFCASGAHAYCALQVQSAWESDTA